MLKILSIVNNITVIHKGYYLCNCRDNSITRNNNTLKNLDIIISIEDSIEYLKKNKKFDENIYNYIVFDHILIESINRVQLQKNKEKRNVIKKLTKYCKDHISDFRQMDFYKEISKNRKIVANLNYHGLSIVSRMLINIKTKLRSRSS